MWEEMLQSNKLDVHMNRTNLLLQMKLHNQGEDASAAIELSHAELVQLLHTLLEANRCFRGDIAFFQN